MRERLEDFRARFAAAKGKHFLRRWWIFRGIRRRFGWKFWAFISGGAALDSETEEFWDRLGYAAIQGYGLTETTSLISVNHPFRLGKGSIGKVLPGREVKLAEDGEILVRGGGVSSGYWDGNGAHKVSDEEGWYRTGDIGALDDAGNLYFKGRKKEVIVTPGGTNVYPEDLEAALRRQPEVKDCVVVGIERGGNAEACAVVILRDEGDVEAVVQRANRDAGGISADEDVDAVAGRRFSADEYAEAAAEFDCGKGEGGDGHEIPTSRAKNAREMGQLDFFSPGYFFYGGTCRIDHAGVGTVGCVARGFQSGFRSGVEFAGPGRIFERAGGPLSDRPERDAVQRGADCGRSGAHAARRSWHRARRFTIRDGRCDGR